jgi:hypothetical protein
MCHLLLSLHRKKAAGSLAISDDLFIWACRQIVRTRVFNANKCNRRYQPRPKQETAASCLRPAAFVLVVFADPFGPAMTLAIIAG